MSWKERAHEAIKEAYLQFTDSTGKMPGPSLDEKDKALLWKIVRGYYPFGERSMHPYKVWCAELRKVKAWLWPVQNACDQGLFYEPAGGPQGGPGS